MANDKWWILRNKKPLIVSEKEFSHFWDNGNEFWFETILPTDRLSQISDDHWDDVDGYIQYQFNAGESLSEDNIRAKYVWEELEVARFQTLTLESVAMYMSNEEIQDNHYITYLRRQAAEDVANGDEIYSYYWCDGPDQTTPQSEGTPKTYRYTFTLDIKASIGIHIHNDLKRRSNLNEKVDILQRLRYRGFWDSTYKCYFFDEFDMPWMLGKFNHSDAYIIEDRTLQSNFMKVFKACNEIDDAEDLTNGGAPIFGFIDTSLKPTSTGDNGTRSINSDEMPNAIINIDVGTVTHGDISMIQNSLYVNANTPSSNGFYDFSFYSQNIEGRSFSFNFDGFFKYYIVQASSIIDNPTNLNVIKAQGEGNAFYLSNGNDGTTTNPNYTLANRLMIKGHQTNFINSGFIDNYTFLIPIFMTYNNTDYLGVDPLSAMLFANLTVADIEKNNLIGKSTITNTSDIGGCVLEIPPEIISLAMAKNTYLRAKNNGYFTFDPTSYWQNSDGESEKFNHHSGCYLGNIAYLGTSKNLITPWAMCIPNSGFNIYLAQWNKNLKEEQYDAYDIFTQVLSWSNQFYNAILPNLKIDPNKWPKNVQINEPYFFTGDMYYLTWIADTSASIKLVQSMMDMRKFFQDAIWEVNLRISPNQTLSYYLNIDDVINDNYPFSNDKRELMFQDPRRFTRINDAFADWSRKGPLQEQISENDLSAQQSQAWKQYGVGVGQNMANSVASASVFGEGPYVALAAGASAISSVFGAIGQSIQQQYQREELSRSITKERMNVSITPPSTSVGAYFADLLLDKGNLDINSQKYRSLFRRYRIHPDIAKVIFAQISKEGFPFHLFEPYINYQMRRQHNFLRADLNKKLNSIYSDLEKNNKVYQPFRKMDFVKWFIQSISISNSFLLDPTVDVYDCPNNIEIDIQELDSITDLSTIWGHQWFGDDWSNPMNPDGSPNWTNIHLNEQKIWDWINTTFYLQLKKDASGNPLGWYYNWDDSYQSCNIVAQTSMNLYMNQTGWFNHIQYNSFDLATLMPVEDDVITLDSTTWGEGNAKQTWDLLDTEGSFTWRTFYLNSWVRQRALIDPNDDVKKVPLEFNDAVFLEKDFKVLPQKEQEDADFVANADVTKVPSSVTAPTTVSYQNKYKNSFPISAGYLTDSIHYNTLIKTPYTYLTVQGFDNDPIHGVMQYFETSYRIHWFDPSAAKWVNQQDNSRVSVCYSISDNGFLIWEDMTKMFVNIVNRDLRSVNGDQPYMQWGTTPSFQNENVDYPQAYVSNKLTPDKKYGNWSHEGDKSYDSQRYRYTQGNSPAVADGLPFMLPSTLEVMRDYADPNSIDPSTYLLATSDKQYIGGGVGRYHWDNNTICAWTPIKINVLNKWSATNSTLVFQILIDKIQWKYITSNISELDNPTWATNSFSIVPDVDFGVNINAKLQISYTIDYGNQTIPHLSRFSQGTGNHISAFWERNNVIITTTVKINDDQIDWFNQNQGTYFTMIWLTINSDQQVNFGGTESGNRLAGYHFILDNCQLMAVTSHGDGIEYIIPLSNNKEGK